MCLILIGDIVSVGSVALNFKMLTSLSSFTGFFRLASN